MNKSQIDKDIEAIKKEGEARMADVLTIVAKLSLAKAPCDSKKAKETGTMKQTVTIKASIGFDRADSLIRYLADKGLSVEAVKPRDQEWTIKAWSEKALPPGYELDPGRIEIRGPFE